MGEMTNACDDLKEVARDSGEVPNLCVLKHCKNYDSVTSLISVIKISNVATEGFLKNIVAFNCNDCDKVFFIPNVYADWFKVVDCAFCKGDNLTTQNGYDKFKEATT